MYSKLLAASLLLGALCYPAAYAVTIGQIDTFGTGTAGWIAPDPGNPNPPTTALGGPGGGTDAYLRLVANGGIFAPELAGSRLTVLNEAQWTGNYLSASIGAIGMDVNNFGPADVSLRLLFESMPVPGPPVAIAFSTNPIVVPAGSGWTHIVLPITPGSLTAPFGSVTTALTNTTVFRLFHNPNAAFGGPNNGPPTISDTFGVDNITAIGVPEPSAWFLLAGGLLTLRARFRR
jgi:hypothetical protein